MPRLFGGFEHNRATCGEGRGNSSGRQYRREIPRRESGDGADRLMHHKLFHARKARRHNAAKDPFAFLGHPFKRIRRAGHFQRRFTQGFDLLEREYPRQLLGLAADRICNRRQYAAALQGRDRAPELICTIGGCDRAIDIVERGDGQHAQLLASGRLCTARVSRSAACIHSPSISSPKRGYIFSPAPKR
jgi:hypothetical protein